MRTSANLVIVASALLAATACGEDAAGPPTLQLEPLAQGLVIDDLQVQLAAGISDPIAFDVPADARAVQITAVGVASDFSRSSVFGDTHGYAVCEWTTGDGTAVVTTGWYDRADNSVVCTDCDNRVGTGTSLATAVLPSTSAARVGPGRHHVRVCALESAHASDVVRVFVHVTTGAERTAGLLDLRIHFDGVAWTAASAQADPDFDAVLDELDTIFEPAGLALGQVTYHDLPAGFTRPDNGAVAEMVREITTPSGGAARTGIDIFVVEHVDGLFPILASALAVPGPLVYGTERSGILVAVEDTRADPLQRTLGHLMAHEIGHYLGLYHTSEAAFSLHDGLDDTALDDDDLLMHALTNGTTITAEQAALMRRSPWVRAAP